MPNVVLISHTEASKVVHPSGIGEIAHSAKFQAVFQKYFKIHPIRLDLYELFGNFHAYETLAELNYSLAEAGNSLLTIENNPMYRDILLKLKTMNPDTLFLLTWCWGIAALFGVGVHHLCPTIAKLYVFHEKEKIALPLYEKSDLLVTESLLANKRGLSEGISPWKMVYMPHQFPENIEKIKPDHSYLIQLAKKNGKSLSLNSTPVIVGIISKLEPRKNCGYALNALAKLATKLGNFLVVLKGNFAYEPECFPPEWELLKREPWFLWDPEPAPFPQVLSQYAVFDLCLQLSGAEGASNTVVELLALGKPVIALEGTTNPYLFKGGALFVKSQKRMTVGKIPYQIPDEKSLEETIESLLTNPQLRKQWGEQAQKIAFTRFHPSNTSERIPLVLTAAKEYRAGNFSLKTQIERLYEKDCKLYGIE